MTGTQQEQVHLTLKQAYQLSFDCLQFNGCDDANAHAATQCMVTAEGDMCHSHGLFRLPWYASSVKSGRVNGSAKPSVKQLAPAVIQVDGDRGFAPIGHGVGHEALADCARANGIAALAFVNMFHISAMWPEVERLADEGLCAFAFTTSYPYVAPAGGMKPLYGTNPMGFAWPRHDAPPLVFDQASSAMARGEIQIAARDGHLVPETAGIGPDGENTTDPNVVLQGAQLGFGGYKGASLAMMVELLAGPLIGAALSSEALEEDRGNGGPPRGGELIMCLDPGRFGDPDNFLSHGERLFSDILSQPGTRLPGARRFVNRERTAKEGIHIPGSLFEEIQELIG
ncbi:MAG: Ldh family oxidoreductase [Acidiferrobacterales bacterium]|nr:Ldh family oxidoreductase [Acidiferrobacterales bacterium]